MTTATKTKTIKTSTETNVDPHVWVGAIRTVKGNPFNLLRPEPHMVDLEEIAHALSMQCRYNGHVPSFYSVAEHSVRVSVVLEDDGHSADVQMAGLLHDAAEAYCGDMVRPMKLVPELGIPFDEIEDGIATVVFAGLGHSNLYPLCEAVHAADKAVYSWEVENIRSGKRPGDTPSMARAAFIDRYEELLTALQW